PTCLAGPSFRQEQWVQRAASAGVPVTAVQRRTAAGAALTASAAPRLAPVVVVGDDCIGPVSPVLEERAQKVARRAGVSLLHAYFPGPPEAPVFLGADVWVDLYQPSITDAVLSLLLRGGTPQKEVS